AHYELEADLDDWVRWAHAHDVDPRLIAFLRFRPDLLFDFDPARYTVAFPSPRSWEYADRALRKFADAPELLGEALQACVGPAAGLACRAYLNHLDTLPDVAAIAEGRDDAVPRGVEMQYAVAAALVRHVARLPRDAQRTAVANALHYARRFPQRELGLMLVIDLQRNVAAPLYEVPAFAEWAAEVGDLLSYERF